MNPVIVVHGGGASNISKDRKERVRQGIIRAATEGYRILKDGGSAVDAVEGAVTVLEDDPEFNAGCGSVLNVNGDVEMDASIMNGKDLSAGAVSAVQGIANPIKLARLVMEKTTHCFLTDQGAAKFATAMGIPTVPKEQLVTERNIKRLEKEKHEKGAPKPDCENFAAAAYRPPTPRRHHSVSWLCLHSFTPPLLDICVVFHFPLLRTVLLRTSGCPLLVNTTFLPDDCRNAGALLLSQLQWIPPDGFPKGCGHQFTFPAGMTGHPSPAHPGHTWYQVFLVLATLVDARRET
ncbi:isoaspartyl peptidase/L-asparaginase isoform X3 [Prionailurus viverrinus]|uniref:isoaspartyl peptidase/L-asparaginase isoform X3 n=1 Tax=Prionailurus viverrinus TaxID=61388 RepID=UPI001FF662E3|nr:isoaspartyl peptidase/L-asparaginase isoform X3 [Prionailurus viverrinus]